MGILVCHDARARKIRRFYVNWTRVMTLRLATMSHRLINSALSLLLVALTSSLPVITDVNRKKKEH